MKRSSSSPNWGELHCDVLESVFGKLPFKDLLRLQSVSSHWFSVSKAVVASKSQSLSDQLPCLLLPPDHTIDGFHCINFNDETIHEVDDNDNLMAASSCVGSSNGWLVLLDRTGFPFLLNPFIRVRTELPCLYSLLNVTKVEKDTILDEFRITYNHPMKNSVLFCTRNLRESFVYKAILTSNPCFGGVDRVRVVVIYGSQRKLGYCKLGDGHGWRELEGGFSPYHDIIACEDMVYALGDHGCVEGWDINGVKKLEIQTGCVPMTCTYNQEDLEYLYVYRPYLVENLGDLLLVVRWIGEFVNKDGVPVREEDLLSDEDTHPLVCPYRTLSFRVHKMDLEGKRWLEVGNLGDRALFLGGNHAVSVPISSDNRGYKRNSIYYTDDYWDRMEEDYLCGGHDAGVFSLDDQTVEPMYQNDPMKVEPPPCWIAPILW